MDVGVGSVPGSGMSVGAAGPVTGDARHPRRPGRSHAGRTGVRTAIVVLVVGLLVVALTRWPEPGPPAQLPDAVGAAPRAPDGPVTWRWSLPQEGSVQYLDVVDDTLVVLDLHRVVTADGDVSRPAQRLRLVDTVDGTTRWEHRLVGNEAVVLLDGDRAATSVVPAALGSPAFVVALDRADGVARWRRSVADVDGITTDDGRVVVHGGRGCLELDPSAGTEGRRLDGGPCLPWGSALARGGAGGWQLWNDDRPLGGRVRGDQPPVSLDGQVVAVDDQAILSRRTDGATAWQLDLDDPPRVVRPWPGIGVRADGVHTSTIVAPDGQVLAQVPWWYRGIVDPAGMTFLDVPPSVAGRGAQQVRIVDRHGTVLATTGLRAGAVDEEVAGSASVAAASRVGPSMFCPATTVACRARRWPAVRLTADGVLMEERGALGLHDLDDLHPRWSVDLHGAVVEALASDGRGVVVLVTDATGRHELRGFA